MSKSKKIAALATLPIAGIIGLTACSGGGDSANGVNTVQDEISGVSISNVDFNCSNNGYSAKGSFEIDTSVAPLGVNLTEDSSGSGEGIFKTWTMSSTGTETFDFSASLDSKKLYVEVFSPEQVKTNSYQIGQC